MAPQQKGVVAVDFGDCSRDGEWFVNVSYSLKKKDGILPEGTVIARQQLPLGNGTYAKAAAVSGKAPSYSVSTSKALIVKGNDFSLSFSGDGWIESYVLGGEQLILPGTVLKPNFWRAPTDNDFGADLQNNYSVWKNPEMKLESFSTEATSRHIIATARYCMAETGAHLTMSYRIGETGTVEVSLSMAAGKENEVANLFRFGVQLTMPRSFDRMEWYGRGPGESYADRKENTFIGIYNGPVSKQYYPYIRPQENGNKTDIRWMTILDNKGKGLKITSEEPFSGSALHYRIETLDEGKAKRNRHAEEIREDNLTNLLIDKVQMGLGCKDSWGALPLEKYMLPYADYSFKFTITPVRQ